MVQRVSKEDAKKILEVSDSTIDRRIQRGELQTERDGRRVWVLLNDEVVGAAGEASADATTERSGGANVASVEASGMLQMKLLEERVRAQDELIAMYKSQNADWEHRYYDLREELAAAHRIAENLSGRSLPAPEGQRRSWWPWRRKKE